MYIDGIPCGGITGGVSDRCLPGDHHVPVVGHHPIAEVGRGEGGGGSTGNHLWRIYVVVR